MSDQTITALSGIVAAAIAALGGGWWGRRKGAADAAEGNARAEATLSGATLVFAQSMKAELDAERAARKKEEEEHAETRRRLAETERGLAEAQAEIVDLKHQVSVLVKEVRRIGGHVPGDTPPHGTPAQGGAP